MQHITDQVKSHIALWYVVQHSISSYHKLIQHFGDAVSALYPSALPIWQQLKLHQNHLSRFEQFHSAAGQTAFKQLLDQILQCCDHVILQQDNHYPQQLKPYSDRPPILFIQGNIECLSTSQIAMVGSRQPSPHGTQVAYDFAYYLAEQKFVVTSGLALGIDAAAHHGAIQSGRSIAVIGTGLDQCYPKVHQPLWQNIIATGGCIVTEFLPITPPSKRNFPRRNRLISALSLGTLVVEAGLNSGSLITAQFAADQGKQVFAIPGHIYSQYHQGCHQLIREGATLVDHPSQVIEDLSMFRSPVSNNSSNSNNITVQASFADTNTTHQLPDIPDHLHPVWQHLDWIGRSIDELALNLNYDISTLSVALIELELLGLCTQHAGRYLRTA
ncbi:DNA-protecting protein DprA [Acinetobacter qingfengensis]|uniref:DNA protecting protein DprA n=2 Tax=Acinetobacter qingfengensis TaxID=1262585 RepID=A0A1E7RCU2_9GAMM|nr:DNA-processing protein DprA [Acinetobacter qingfengensis]KAA8732088.1 DNA-protecting protein DprA [Acinetobacter qingfengensis]OEY97168.1 DNA protecting protein DprA [Acinetobacter qingfengensis]